MVQSQGTGLHFSFQSRVMCFLSSSSQTRLASGSQKCCPEAGSALAVSPQGLSFVLTELGMASLHGLCHPSPPSP